LGTSGDAGYPVADQHGNIFAFTASATFVKSSSFVIDGSWGLTRSLQILSPIDGNVKYGSEKLGIPGVNLSPLPAGGGLPQFNINGYAGYGYSYPYSDIWIPYCSTPAMQPWSKEPTPSNSASTSASST
jgi:hypothetical protein